MPRMNIFNALEREAFDAPPVLTSVERKQYFDFPIGLLKLAATLRTPTNIVCFLTTAGYFRATRKFFAGSFSTIDLEYVAYEQQIAFSEVNPETYDKQTAGRHRRLIIEFFGFTELNLASESIIREEMTSLIRARLKPLFEAEAHQNQSIGTANLKQNHRDTQTLNLFGDSEPSVLENSPKPVEPVHAHKKAAELVNVSDFSIKQADTVLKQGAPELVKVVESGQVAVSAAATVAKNTTKEEQEVLIQQGPIAIKEKAKELRERAEVARQASTPDRKSSCSRATANTVDVGAVMSVRSDNLCAWSVIFRVTAPGSTCRFKVSPLISTATGIIGQPGLMVV